MRWAERVRRAGWLASSRAPRAVCASAPSRQKTALILQTVPRLRSPLGSRLLCYLSGQVTRLSRPMIQEGNLSAKR